MRLGKEGIYRQNNKGQYQNLWNENICLDEDAMEANEKTGKGGIRPEMAMLQDPQDIGRQGQSSWSCKRQCPKGLDDK